MTKSLAFDQAAPYYDKTRVNPEWVQHAIADSIIAETHATRASKLLEVGVGTGRIALPLLERGYEVVGVDLSLAMMGELQKKGEGKTFRFALAQADAERLPFPDETFVGVYAVHVYHLVADWRHALRDAYRVLKPGGALMASFHHRIPNSPNRLLRNKLNDLIEKFGVDARRPGVQSSEKMVAELALWSQPRLVEVAQWIEQVRPAQILDELAAQIYSDTWLIPPDILKRVMPELRQYAQAEFGDLNHEISEDARFTWAIARK